MGHVFRADSFIASATALDNLETDGRGNAGIAQLVENSLSGHDAGGNTKDIDEVISLASCRLSGDRVFVIYVIEDQTTGD